MTNEERAEHLWRALNSCCGLNKDLTISTVTHWLEYHGAGMPEVPLMEERVRDDAKLWAACANQAELEAYLAAAVIEMEKTPITHKVAKRMAALSWRTMNAEDRVKFKNWIDQQ